MTQANLYSQFSNQANNHEFSHYVKLETETFLSLRLFNSQL